MMRSGSLFLAACISFASATVAFAEDRALLVGVGNYRDAQVNDLPGVNLDVEMMRRVASALGFPESGIKTLFDQEATLENIRVVFDEWLVGGAGPNDRVLFYFSGHGSYIPDGDGDETDDHLDEVLLPHDTQVSKEGLRNVLTDDVLGQWLAKLPSNATYVLIDACHSGSVTKSTTSPADAVVKFFGYAQLPASVGPPKPRDATFVDIAVTRSGAARYVALAAAADNEQSLASSQGSYFTIGVQQAVTNAAAKRRVTLRDVQQVSADEIKRLAPASKVHHPQLGGDLTLADANLFDKGVVRPVTPWAVFEGVADGASTRLEIRQVQPAYSTSKRERMRLEIDVPREGFLNVITVSEIADVPPVVLFPNEHHRDNQVTPGRLTLPATGARYQYSFALPPGRTEERNLLVVFLTDEPLDAYKLGTGSDVMRELSNLGIRATRGAVVSEAGYAAGKAIYVLRK